VGVILALGLLINSLILSDQAKVTIVPTEGSQHVFLRDKEVYSAAASDLLTRSWANTTKLTVDTRQLAAAMRQQFPELEHVSVTLPIFSHQPEFVVRAAPLALLLKSSDGGSLFVIDNAGRALINASQVSGIGTFGLVVVEDQSGLPIHLGHSALPKAQVSFITEVLRQLKAKGVEVTSGVLPKGTSEFDLRITGQQYAVKFNLRGDARVETGAFLAVKEQLEREHKTPAAYIDVRVDNRAYYR
jgi:hypothetical protein